MKKLGSNPLPQSNKPNMSRRISEDRTYIEENNCDKCENIDICKWCEEMKITQEYVNNIPKVKVLTPIRIKVTCDSFKKKIEVPHGWTSGIR